MQKYLSKTTEKDLGFDFILNKLQPASPYGKEAKEGLKPFLPGMEEKLEQELDKLEIAYTQFKKNPDEFKNIKALLGKIKEIRNALNKTSVGILDDVELFEIKSFIFTLDEISEAVIKAGLEEIVKFYPMKPLKRLLDPSNKGRKTFYFEDDYSKTLKKIRQKRRKIEQEIRSENSRLHMEIINRYNIKLNPNGEIHVSKGNRELIEKIEESGLLIYLKESFATLTFALKPSLKLEELNTRLNVLKTEEDEEERNIRKNLTQEVEKYKSFFLKNIESLTYLDLLVSKVYLAVETNAVRPEITRDDLIIIKNGRHVWVEELLKQKGLSFTPVSIQLKSPVTIITGANMGGKTVALKLIGLLASMAQYGFFVPAEEMKLSLRRFIFFSGSFKESLTEGLSSFGAEIKAIGEILNQEYTQGLILIDELAKGTNPPEAVCIATALISKLLKRSCFTLITTHFHQLTSIRGVKHLRVKGLSDLDLKDLSKKISENFLDGIETLNRYMDYKLEEVSESLDVPKDAIKVARIMGFDSEILDEAEKLLINFSWTDGRRFKCSKN